MGISVPLRIPFCSVLSVLFCSVSFRVSSRRGSRLDIRPRSRQRRPGSIVTSRLVNGDNKLDPRRRQSLKKRQKLREEEAKLKDFIVILIDWSCLEIWVQYATCYTKPDTESSRRQAGRKRKRRCCRQLSLLHSVPRKGTPHSQEG